MRRSPFLCIALGAALAVCLSSVSFAGNAPAWKRTMRSAARGLPMSVELRYDGEVLFRRDAKEGRPPASVQKLLLSMAMFDLDGSDHQIKTALAAKPFTGNVLRGNLWVLGKGDPSVSSKAGSGRRDFPTRLGLFVKRIRSEGITRVTGSVAASKGYFSRDWDAPGWRPSFQKEEVALPTALTIDGNSRNGRFIRQPERILARKLTQRLRKKGVRVEGKSKVGRPPQGVTGFAVVKSAPLWVLARGMNKISNNFFAEVLGKRLGARVFDAPGTIGKGARAVESFARSQGVSLRAFDSSGLSFANRVSPRSLVRLLDYATEQPWWRALRRGLPKGGEGTLVDRLEDVPLRAKTGTLNGVSSLAGWVWMDRVGDWAEFAIMSRGLSKERAVQAEDKIVRIANGRARP